MSRSKLLIMTLLAFGLVFISLNPTAQAEESFEWIKTENKDCMSDFISAYVEEQEDVTWSDVCYSPEFVEEQKVLGKATGEMDARIAELEEEFEALVEEVAEAAADPIVKQGVDEGSDQQYAAYADTPEVNYVRYRDTNADYETYTEVKGYDSTYETKPTGFSTTHSVDNDDEYWNLSIFGGYTNHTDDALFDDGGYVAGRLTYDISKYIELGVESGYRHYEDSVGDEIHAIPLLGVALLKYPFETSAGTFAPYLVGALGTTYWNYSESTTTADAGIEVDDDWDFTAKVGVGVDYLFSENVGIFVEGSYMWSDYEVDLSSPLVSGRGEFDADNIFVGGGLKLMF